MQKKLFEMVHHCKTLKATRRIEYDRKHNRTTRRQDSKRDLQKKAKHGIGKNEKTTSPTWESDTVLESNGADKRISDPTECRWPYIKTKIMKMKLRKGKIGLLNEDEDENDACDRGCVRVHE